MPLEQLEGLPEDEYLTPEEALAAAEMDLGPYSDACREAATKGWGVRLYLSANRAFTDQIRAEIRDLNG